MAGECEILEVATPEEILQVVTPDELLLVVDQSATELLQIEQKIETLEVEQADEILEIIERGEQGVPGPTPYEIIDFAYDTASPLTLDVMLAGDFILDTEVEILTPFDDPAATLSVGTAGDNDLILGVGDIKPTRVANYGNQGNFKFTVIEQLRLFITPGTSTQGVGRVTLTKR